MALWPAASRPFIDGSPDNSILNLIFGYNGLSRLSGGTGGAGSGFSGATGVFRLFNDLMGGQASWLLPAALVALVAGLVWRGRAPRTDRTRAALLLWGGWLLVTGAVFSFSSGVIHTYYTVALAPAIAALVGIGGALLWQNRHRMVARIIGCAAIVVHRRVGLRPARTHPGLRPVAATADPRLGILAAAALVAAPAVPRLTRHLTALAIGTRAGGRPGRSVGLHRHHPRHRPHRKHPVGRTCRQRRPRGWFRRWPGRCGRSVAREPPAGGQVRGFPGPPAPVPPGCPARRRRANRPAGFAVQGVGGRGAAGQRARPRAGRRRRGRPAGGGADTSTALTAALRSNAATYRWVAATFGSQSAATLELASDEPVMAIGGFNGQGGNISLATFEPTWPRATSTTSSPPGPAVVGAEVWADRAAGPTATRPSPAGSRRTSPPRPSAVRPSTT